ncbi:MAG TPA: RluA family pseudouridine synthase [Candidatus Micrarchaeia archaeon]|nr:RluA family pseudouridine synthase [Candidatus Micrarchaeia archaeon]
MTEGGGAPPAAAAVPPDADGWRLDRWIAHAIPTGRHTAQELVRRGAVAVNGRPQLRPAVAVRAGDRVAWTPCRPAEGPAVAGALPPPELRLVHVDAWIAIVDKPSGLTVHPGAGRPDGTLADGIRALGGGWSTLAGAPRMGIVHRLDRTVSGLLAVARTEAAHRHLAAQLRDRSMGRDYWALVHGSVREDKGRVVAPVGRDPRRPRRMAVVAGGRDAVTDFEVLDRLPAHTVLRVSLGTGRTHQIRLHLAYIGRPLVGDPLYGPQAERGQDRPMLHAAELRLVHPRGDRLRFRSPLPAELAQGLADRGGDPRRGWPGPAAAGAVPAEPPP